MKHRNKAAAAAILVATAATGAGAAPVQWAAAAGGNDHWYEIVSVGTPAQGNPSLRKPWNDARADALARTHLGLNGYLATVTSAAENLFIGSLEGPFQTRNGWLGGSDAAVEGEWRWMDGPEAGLLFWLGTSTGSSPGYAGWGNSWPNSDNFLNFIDGSWASIGERSEQFYYVEYSAALPPPNGVPVPGTLSLAALALAGLGLVRRPLPRATRSTT